MQQDSTGHARTLNVIGNSDVLICLLFSCCPAQQASCMRPPYCVRCLCLQICCCSSSEAVQHGSLKVMYSCAVIVGHRDAVTSMVPVSSTQLPLLVCSNLIVELRILVTLLWSVVCLASANSRACKHTSLLLHVQTLPLQHFQEGMGRIKYFKKCCLQLDSRRGSAQWSTACQLARIHLTQFCTPLSLRLLCHTLPSLPSAMQRQVHDLGVQEFIQIECESFAPPFWSRSR